MNDSKRSAVSLNALSMFENALTMFWNDFEMDLQRISVLLKNIANVSKRNGNVLQRVVNALKCIVMEKCYNAIFVKPNFPKEGHIWCRVQESNPGHIGGRRVLSPLHQPCFVILFGFILVVSRLVHVTQHAVRLFSVKELAIAKTANYIWTTGEINLACR